MNGQEVNGIAQYSVVVPGGEVTVDEETLAEYIPDLTRYMPAYYENGSLVREIADTNARELGRLQYMLDSAFNQCFVNTSDWGLALWERQLRLNTGDGESSERRREIIVSKLRGAGTATKKMLQNTAAAFSGGEVEVLEHPSEHRFEIQFVGTLGIPPNMPGLIQVLNDIKPAHLSYGFKYTFTVWSMLDMTWQEARAKTWDELRIYKGA